MQALSSDDLHAHPEALTVAAHAGQPALVTDQGQPLFLTVPCDETLLREGVHVALAVGLFRAGELSSGKAAEVARMPRVAFLGLVSRLGIAVVDYAPEELDGELASFE